MWPLIFCQHTIHQVIWPSPGTPPCLVHVSQFLTLLRSLYRALFRGCDTPDIFGQHTDRRKRRVSTKEHGVARLASAHQEETLTVEELC